MKAANYAPVYAGLYPELAEIARSKGYAMAVHGSLARDADLICIPWTDGAEPPEAVVTAIEAQFVIRRVSGPRTREHGRLVFTLTIAGPGCFIDLSFTPRALIPEAPAQPELASAAANQISTTEVGLQEAPAEGWQPISSAPTNRAIQIHVPSLDYYGNGGVYAGMLVDMGTGRRWMTFGWAIGRDLGPENTPTHWRPLPPPPSQDRGPDSQRGAT